MTVRNGFVATTHSFKNIHRFHQSFTAEQSIDSLELPTTYQLIKQFGLQAHKAFGQNFIINPAITDRLVQHLPTPEQSWVLEVGPGPGGLTRSLLQAGVAKVVAIEKDPRCLAILQLLAQRYPQRLVIVNADALEVNELELLRQYNPQGLIPQIVANLPYNISTILLHKWLLQTPLWQGMLLMFQKEVADKLVAAPATKAYGRLSILAQLAFQIRRVITLAPSAFVPPPKIKSSVLHFQLRSTAPEVEQLRWTEAIVDCCFRQRRQTLSHLLKTHSVTAKKMPVLAGSTAFTDQYLDAAESTASTAAVGLVADEGLHSATHSEELWSNYTAANERTQSSTIVDKSRKSAGMQEKMKRQRKSGGIRKLPENSSMQGAILINPQHLAQLLEQQGVDLRQRPEELSCQQFLAVAQAYALTQ